jgi:hypothetical protein
MRSSGMSPVVERSIEPHLKKKKKTTDELSIGNSDHKGEIMK